MVHIKRLQEEGIDILAIIGEIDASSSIELDLAIAKSVGEGFRKILIDCSSLEYISSAGLGVFMSYIEEFKDRNIAVNCLCLGSVQTEMFEAAFPSSRASVSPENMGEYVAQFATIGQKYFNGKIIPVHLYLDVDYKSK